MTLRELFAETFGVPLEGITEDTSPRTLRKWDSLVHLQLITAIEHHYRVRFSVSEMTTIRSFRAAEDILRRKGLAP
jgi:acyl carrier protein